MLNSSHRAPSHCLSATEYGVNQIKDCTDSDQRNQQSRFFRIETHFALLGVNSNRTSRAHQYGARSTVPHRSTNRARQCLTSQSERDAVLSLLYGRS